MTPKPQENLYLLMIGLQFQATETQPNSLGASKLDLSVINLSLPLLYLLGELSERSKATYSIIVAY